MNAIALTQPQLRPLHALMVAIAMGGMLIVPSCEHSTQDGAENHRGDNPTRLHEGRRGRTIDEISRGND